MKITWIHGKLYLKKYGPGTLILEIFQLIFIKTERLCDADIEISSKIIVNKFSVAHLSPNNDDNDTSMTPPP